MSTVYALGMTDTGTAPTDLRTYAEKLRAMLSEAHVHAHHVSRDGVTSAMKLSRIRGERDGLLDAFCLLTGRDQEDVYDDLQAALGD
jgi:hypothetical protein